VNRSLLSAAQQELQGEEKHRSRNKGIGKEIIIILIINIIIDRLWDTVIK
jgi:hypothetical protein